MLRKVAQLLKRSKELDPLVNFVVEVARLADFAWSALFRFVDDPQVRSALLCESPRLALGGPEQPALPLTVAIGLVTEELDPRERGGVVDVLARSVHARVEHLDEPVVELEIELRLVAAEPYWGLV